MSAYIVDRETICYLTRAASTREGVQHSAPLSWRAPMPGGAEWRNLHPTNKGAEDAFGQMLWNENIKSVGYRYPGMLPDELPGPVGETLTYEHRITYTMKPIDWVQVLKTIAAYRYQACEHPDWPDSEAYAAIDALERKAIHNLPGYEDAEWGAPNDMYPPNELLTAVLDD